MDLGEILDIGQNEILSDNSDNGRLSRGHADHQTLQEFHRSTGPLIQKGLAEFLEVMWGMIPVFDCTPQFIPQTLNGLQPEDYAGWSLLVMCSCYR